MSNDKLKERIAEKVASRICGIADITFCCVIANHPEVTCGNCHAGNWVESVILADPEIKRGLELLELEKHGKLAELADNQETPPNPYPDGVGRANIYGREFRVHQTIQQDMISAGWLKCKPREVK